MASREHLFHLLAEAAELEHNILCSYLYAVFSLKQREDEDATAVELQAIGRWRKELMGLCVEEMVHLAQVCNLLVALGSRPHFNRPNLPAPPGYHPAGIAIGLSPFDMETLEHFIFLERPEDIRVADSKPFQEPTGSMPRREPEFEPLMPRAPHYETIGEFYTALRDKLESAAAEMGEMQLLCGATEFQISGDEVSAPGLIVVTSLEDARQAIGFIVEQGEGSGASREDSHFGKFSSIKAELLALVKSRPGFHPSRDVVTNAVMHAPVETGRVHIDGTLSAPVIDAANAVYGLMLRCLAKLYEVPRLDSAVRKSLLDGAMAAMKTVAGLGMGLTELPARDGEAKRAGMSFAMLRSVEGPWGERDLVTLQERFMQVADRLPQLPLPAALTAPLAKALRTAKLAPDTQACGQAASTRR